MTLPWDPGTIDAGALAYAHPDTAPGDYWFRITTQSTASGGWRTALKVHSGEAHVYMKLGSLPTPASFDDKSERTGSDGWVLRPDQFSAGQQWFVLVRVIGAASWTLCSGEVFVQNPGPLQWNDNGNGVYDIGEIALPSGQRQRQHRAGGHALLQSYTAPRHKL